VLGVPASAGSLLGDHERVVGGLPTHLEKLWFYMALLWIIMG
jgi:hypothetical protein